MRFPLSLALVGLALFALSGCAEVDKGVPADTDTGADVDSDADTDTDVDTDTGTDTNPVGCEDEGDCGGDPCVDGYCCDGTCEGICEACDVAGSEGLCTPHPAGEDPEEECAEEDPATCGLDGACDGAAACRYYGAETACDDATDCTEGDACDGAGGCTGEPGAECDPGPANECCAGACTDEDGCYTEVDACPEICDAGALTVGRECAGCGPANAEGVCAGGTTVQCTTASHALCTAQLCGGATYYCTNDGGSWAWRTAIPCDDGDPCTYDDTCSSGSCLATSYECTSDTCMERACDGAGGCEETPIPDVECGTTACPADTCAGGDWQDYGATCANSCSDAGECATCTCAAATTDCALGAGNECCETACSPSGGCYTVAGSCGGTDTCGDVNTKIVGSVCAGCGGNGAAGTCEGGGTFTCSAGSHTACQNVSCGGTTYYCTNAGGSWQWRTSPGCDDANACTYGDTCGSSSCGGTLVDCDGMDTACADYTCDGDATCAVAYSSGSCSDGNPCTYGETCDGAGSCGGGTVNNCDALDTTCVDYSCDGDASCAVSYPTGTACVDSNPCTYDTTCNGAGACGGGSTASCDALDTACMDYSCDGDATCASTPINLGGSCTDANPCTYGTACNAAGSCAGGSNANCDALDTTCVDYSCDGDATCAVYYPSGTTCTDADPCTYNTTCNGLGGCAGGSNANCDALDTYCMNYTCDGDATCASAPQHVGLACDDGNPATSGDVCLSSGVCAGTSCTYPAAWGFAAGAESWSYSNNWIYSSTGGSPGGFMRFNDEVTHKTSYSIALTSPAFSLIGCTSATLQYSIMLDDYLDTYWGYDEYIRVQCSDADTGWYTLASYVDGDDYDDLSFSWGVHTHAIPAACRDLGSTSIRFLAEGDDSWYFNYWGVDTVSVY